MTERLDLPRRYRDKIEALLREHVPGVEVWAYGSRVNGRSHEGSDLDLVLRGPDLRWWAIIVLLLAFAVTVSFSLAQTEEPSAVNAPTSVKVQSDSVEAQSSSDEPEQKQPTLIPNRYTAPADVETERRFNELRRELLDDRAKTIEDRAKMIDWWLVVIAIVLTFFGIAVPIIAYNRLNKLEEIEKEARRYVEEIKTIRDKVEINRAFSEAILLQQQNRTSEAIEKWHSIANIKEGTDDKSAAEAWFSVGYLTSPKNVKGEDFAGAIDAYNKAIGLNLSGPDLYWAYYNRGNAKVSLGSIEAAIADYDEAIRLHPFFSEAYNNRGNEKARLNRIDEARQDFKTALNLAQAAGNTELMKQARLNLENLDSGDAP